MSYNQLVISLLSYNIELGKKFEEIIAWIRGQARYDIICFQEFPEEKISKFSEYLSGYNYEFVISLSRKKERFGQLTLFDNTKFKLLNKQVVNIGPSMAANIIYRNKLDRNILLTTLSIAGKIFILANIHLTPITWNKRKIQQVQKIISLLDDMPTVLVGDFNYSSLMNLKRLTLILEKQGFIHDTPKFITYQKFIIRHQLDYIFSKRCKIEDVKVDKIRFSDHLPISANLIV